MRSLRDGELKALCMLAERLNSDERARLVADLDGASVEEVTGDGSRLLFYLRHYERPPYQGQHAYTVGGLIKDSDGDEVSVVIYADTNNRLLELELIKWGKKPLVQPDWSTFEVQY